MFLRAPRMDTDDEERRTLAEIAFFETRISQLGDDGDCACEKALVRQYRQLIAERQAVLRTSP